MRRIFFDNAATSWPKPESVYRVVEDYLRSNGAPAGRSVYREAGEADRIVSETRQKMARFIGAEDLSRIVFTASGTDALNLALQGTLRPGDHVITSVLEHNSVLRPLQALAQTRDVSVTHVPCSALGYVDPDLIQAEIRPNTKLIALIHASNVLGTIQPIESVGKIAQNHGVLFLIDAAQSVGYLPFDARELSADLIAFPGHKGLLGPLGVGVLYLAPGVEDQVRSVRQGGTGTKSESLDHPASMPEKFEAGNHNVPAIAGLGAGIEFLESLDIEAQRTKHREMVDVLLAACREIDGISSYGPDEGLDRLGVISLSMANCDVQEFASLLDASFRIQVRSGLHCAPLAHKAIGTIASGGTVRFSFGHFNTVQDLQILVAALNEIAPLLIKP